MLPSFKWGATYKIFKRRRDLCLNLISLFHFIWQSKDIILSGFSFLTMKNDYFTDKWFAPIAPASALYSSLFNDIKSILKTLLYWRKILVGKCNLHCADKFWQLLHLYICRGASRMSSGKENIGREWKRHCFQVDHLHIWLGGHLVFSVKKHNCSQELLHSPLKIPVVSMR